MDIDRYITDRAASATTVAAGVTRRTPDPNYRCGTCRATFATWPLLEAHLERAYHGVQCLACGAVHATRGAFEDHIHRAHPALRLPCRARPPAPGDHAGQAPYPGAHRDNAGRRRTR